MSALAQQLGQAHLGAQGRGLGKHMQDLGLGHLQDHAGDLRAVLRLQLAHGREQRVPCSARIRDPC